MSEPEKESIEQYLGRVSTEISGDILVAIEALKTLKEDAPPEQEQRLLAAIGHLYLASAALALL